MTPRTRAELVGAPLLLLLGLGAGRFTSPARVDTHVLTVEKVRLQEVTKEVTTTAITTDDEKGGTFTGKRTTTTAACQGGQVVTVVEDGTVVWGEHAKTATKQQLSLEIARTQESSRTEEKTVHIENAPRWTVFGGAGVSGSFSPLGVSPVYVAGAQYRLLGPLSIGAWGTFDQARTRPTIGVLAAISF